MIIRKAGHAGSWYSADKATLTAQLTRWLQQANSKLTNDAHLLASLGRSKAIISPHAGYRYSGSTAAFSFAALEAVVTAQPELNRIVILGPSHHLPLASCAIPTATIYETPLGNITIDLVGLEALRASAASAHVDIDTLTLKQDEEEHSVEMQLPFVYHVMSRATPSRVWSLLPILGTSWKRLNRIRFA